MNTYYKLVNVLNDGVRDVRQSVNVSNINPSKYTTKYIPYEWITAPIGGLLVFNSLDCAESFMVGLYDPVNNIRVYELWECEVEDKLLLPPLRSDAMDDSSIEGTWTRDWTPAVLQDWDKEIDYTPCWPSGTCAFRKVKLTKCFKFRVKDEIT